MLGHSSGFYAHVKKVSPICTFMYCMIHREALASKTLGPDLKEVLRQVIILINTVKSSALNTRLFRLFCEQMDADHSNLLYHTEVQWLSKGNLFKRVFTLRNELRDFFVQQKKEDLVEYLHEDVVSLAYLVDIFSRLNELNLSLQGQDKTIVNFIDALSAFQAKLELWERKMTMGQMGMFPTLNEFIEDAEDMRLDNMSNRRLSTIFYLFPLNLQNIFRTQQEMIWYLLEAHTLSQTQTLSTCSAEMMQLKRNL